MTQHCINIIICSTSQNMYTMMCSIVFWYRSIISIFFTMRHCRNPLRWRRNGRDSASNHQPHDCLLNRLFRRRSKETSNLRVTGFCAGNSPGTGEIPAQKWPVTRKMFPFDDVIMPQGYWLHTIDPFGSWNSSYNHNTATHNKTACILHGACCLFFFYLILFSKIATYHYNTSARHLRNCGGCFDDAIVNVVMAAHWAAVNGPNSIWQGHLLAGLSDDNGWVTHAISLYVLGLFIHKATRSPILVPLRPLSQTSKTFRSTSISYRHDARVSSRSLSYVNPTVFDIWYIYVYVYVIYI